LLTVSIVVSLMLHSALIALAPRVHLLKAAAAKQDVMHLFKVEFLDELDVTEPAAESAGENLSTDSGSLEELFELPEDPLEELVASLERAVDVPELDERLAQEGLTREHDLTPDGSTFERVDTHILEIAEGTAREGIDVARRMVAPSTQRVLDPGETPSLSGGDDLLGGELLMIPAMPRAFVPDEAEGAEPVLEEPTSLAPMPEETAPAVPEPEAGLPDLPEEVVVARSPVMEDVRREQPYEFLDDMVDMQLDTYTVPGESQGYFRLQIVPKEGESIPVLPKDVTFVVDASNSIIQRKLDETTRGIRESLTMLRDEDRFNIVAFRDRAIYFQPELTYATPEAKREAARFLEELESFGETDVYKAVKPVVAEPARPGVPKIVMVFSDGRPTTGVKNGRDIINGLTEENLGGSTIYAFGGGRTVNRYLLDLLAYRNRGESRVTNQVESIDSELPKFFSTLSDPILTDCALDYGRIDETEVYPKDAPDFYEGQAVTIYGRFDPAKDKEFAIRLTGQAEERKKEVVFRANLGEAETGSETIARNWAFRKVYYLIGEICRVGETPELLAELRALSQAYNIRTSYD